MVNFYSIALLEPIVSYSI